MYRRLMVSDQEALWSVYPELDCHFHEKILAHFQGKDASVSTSLRPESRAPPADVFG